MRESSMMPATQNVLPFLRRLARMTLSAWSESPHSRMGRPAARLAPGVVGNRREY